MSVEFDEQLLKAAEYCDLSAMKEAVKQGANVNAEDSTGETALVKIAGSTNPAAFQAMTYLVEKGAIVNCAKKKNILSIVVVSRNNSACLMLNYLIEHGRRHPDGSWGRADVNARGQDGYSPLLSAFWSEAPYTRNTIRLLVEHGADINARYENKNTLLTRIAGTHHPYALDVIECLVEYGADVNARNQYGYSALDEVINCGSDRIFDIVKCLVRNGAILDFEEKADCSTLMYAALSFDIAPKLVKYLVEQGHANVNAQNKDGQSVLAFALSNESVESIKTVKYLVKRGADIYAKDNNGESLPKLALEFGNYDAAQYLVDIGNFSLSDVMPISHPESDLKPRDTVISRVLTSLETKGLAYARSLAAEIATVLKKTNPKVTDADIEALKPIVDKLTSMDFMGDAEVTSGDFDVPWYSETEHGNENPMR